MTDTGEAARGLSALRQAIAALEGADLTYGMARALRALKEELALYGNHLAGQAALADMPQLCPRWVQLGGGAHVLPGWFNIDIVPPADLLCDVREGLPLPTGSVSRLFSEHFLEHVDYPRSAKFIIAEMYRVLEAGGEVVLGVPNAELVLNAYNESDFETLQRYLDSWYAGRDCIGDFNTAIDWVCYVLRDQEDHPVYHPHYWGYDYEKLVSLFTEAGFDRVERWAFDPTIANSRREWGSIYVRATK